MFIGQTRFSLFNPGSTDWVVSSGGRFRSSADYLDYLYSDERMALRAEIFFEHSIPMLARSSKRHKLIHVLSYSDNLPDKYQKRLEAEAEKHRFLVLDKRPAGEGATPWQQLLDAQIETGEIIGFYRLDDDDLLGDDFFDDMSAYIEEPFVTMAVSFGSGYTAIVDGEKIIYPRASHWPKIAIGLTYIHQKIGPRDFVGPKYKGGHNQVDRYNPVVLDSRKPSYFWLRSPEQDTLTNVPSSQRVAHLVEKLHNLQLPNREELQRLFPTLDSVRFPTKQILLDSEKKIERSETFLFESPASTFSVEFDYRASKGIERRNYILQFSMVNNDGTQLPGSAPAFTEETEQAQTEKPVKVEGISLSPNPAVGYFKYIPLRAGNRSGSISIKLPDGMKCNGLAVREWKKPPRPVLFKNLRVEIEE
ncbi:glycosyltransferase [Corynebacterium marquesiae]|uniref:glycosyltransferase n=1 Tax=Corynebacterium marquesiae TaxID=2913503 RepID=UPI0018E1CD1F|nr:hypothetical protein I6H50_07225 [Corynebacterium tuberculostearicum]